MHITQLAIPKAPLFPSKLASSCLPIRGDLLWASCCSRSLSSEAHRDRMRGFIDFPFYVNPATIATVQAKKAHGRQLMAATSAVECGCGCGCKCTGNCQCKPDSNCGCCFDADARSKRPISNGGCGCGCGCECECESELAPECSCGSGSGCSCSCGARSKQHSRL
jgi:hypothetical protein